MIEIFVEIPSTYGLGIDLGFGFMVCVFFMYIIERFMMCDDLSYFDFVC